MRIIYGKDATSDAEPRQLSRTHNGNSGTRKSHVTIRQPMVTNDEGSDLKLVTEMLECGAIYKVPSVLSTKLLLLLGPLNGDQSVNPSIEISRKE